MASGGRMKTMNPYDPNDIEPFKLLRDGNYVLHIIILIITIPAAIVLPASLIVSFAFIFISPYMIWNSLFGNGDYGLKDGRLTGKSLGERFKIGFMWK